MARPVDLDPGTYAGTYKLVGGSLALDFANLVSYRGDHREHDWLDPPSNVSRWCAAVGLDAAVAEPPAELKRFREVTARTFLAIAEGARPTDADLSEIGARAAGVWARRRLRFPAEASAAQWVVSAASLSDEVAAAAAALLTSADALLRVSACSGCGWLFLDTSRNRRRQWCDPADCGNRARQRRHYERHAQSAQAKSRSSPRGAAASSQRSAT